MIETVLAFLGAYAAELSAAGVIGGGIWWLISRFRKDKPTQLAPETIEQIAPPRAKDGPALTIPEFIRLRRELKADLEQELAEAAEGEKAQLTARIAELESQIANPDKALEEANKRIADLEALLDRAGNQIGGDRIAEAKAALEQGDYSVADEIFAEIEARNTLAVQETARAAFGRGEVAEAEVRWHDAYTHYKRAVDLNDTLDHLKAYARLCWRLVRGAESVAVQERLVAMAKQDHGEDSPEYAAQLNNLAEMLRAQGRYEEAEGLFRQALEIDRATIGEGHPVYATHLNNLALVLEAQGRCEEAEGLYGEALEIARATIGEEHPNYASGLNNLASVVETQGRYEEAEGLYREALEIGRATIGEGHPAYAARLGNLGQLLGQMGRTEEARGMLEQCLAIFRDTLPPEHPYIAEAERRIADLPGG